MPRIYMPPQAGLLGNGKYTVCMVYGDSLEIQIDKAGYLEIDNTSFFTTPFVNGDYPKDDLLGPYYAAARNSETCFHFTVSADGKKYDVELMVKDVCP